MTDEVKRAPFLAACGACRYLWPAAWLPMPLADADRLLLKTSCPSCAGPPKQILIPTKAQAEAWYSEQTTAEARVRCLLMTFSPTGSS